MRQIVLDTETTGLETSLGHRVIEVGCIELVDRRVTGNDWHHYFNPGREVDAGAFEVHGISNDFLSDKPAFGELAEAFHEYLRGAELIIHNAAFDVGFLDYEFNLLPTPLAPLDEICSVLDTLMLARQKHPGQKNNLDALCKRYDIDNSQRSLHGALLDARILADVYLAMTGGQTSLGLDVDASSETSEEVVNAAQRLTSAPLPLWQPAEEDIEANRQYVEYLAEQHPEPAWK